MKTITITLMLSLSAAIADAQSWAWGKQGTNEAEISNVGADARGNAFQTGYFLDTISFGTYTLHSVSAVEDVFFIKYDSSGNIAWVKQSVSSGAVSYGFGNAEASDAWGNVYLLGGFADTIVFDKDTLKNHASFTDCFVVKYDTKGNVIWARQSSGGADGQSVSTDPSGNIYVTGALTPSAVTFGSYILSGVGDAFLVKYDTNGNVLWAKQSKAANVNSAAGAISVAADAAGNTFITGQFNDTVSFGSKTLMADSGETNVFLVKYDPNGNVLWAKQSTVPGTVSYGTVHSVATDINGNAYILGDFQDTISFGPFTLRVGKFNAFLVKYDPNGNVIWAKQSYGTATFSTLMYSLVSDRRGHLFISGSLGATMAFCNDTVYLSSFYGDNSVVMEIDTSGNAICAAIACTGGDDGNGIACDPSGRYVYFGGDVGYSCTFGSDNVFPVGSNEPPFVARWLPCTHSLESVNNISENLPRYTILYPNPNNGVFTIAQSGEIQSERIEIYNVLGEKVYSNKFLIPNSQFLIDISDKPSGIYLLKILAEDGSTIVRKIEITK